MRSRTTLVEAWEGEAGVAEVKGEASMVAAVAGGSEGEVRVEVVLEVAATEVASVEVGMVVATRVVMLAATAVAASIHHRVQAVREGAAMAVEVTVAVVKVVAAPAAEALVAEREVGSAAVVMVEEMAVAAMVAVARAEVVMALAPMEDVWGEERAARLVVDMTAEAEMAEAAETVVTEVEAKATVWSRS